MTPRPVARNAARKSSAAPAVAVPASTAMGPPYAGAAPRGRTVSAGRAGHLVAAVAPVRAGGCVRGNGVIRGTPYVRLPPLPLKKRILEQPCVRRERTPAR